MRKLFFFFLLLLACGPASAQNTMRVEYKDGRVQDIPLTEIGSLSFVTLSPSADTPATLTGSWLWGSQAQGYYELLVFSPQNTYTGYDRYFTYGFDTTTYGWYTMFGNMLTLQSNGFGYRRVYNWFVMGLTADALEVMTQTGPFTYYRLQPETLHLTTLQPWQGQAEDDTVVFADGVIASVEGGKLYGAAPGTTYVQIRHGADGRIVAYKVVVD